MQVYLSEKLQRLLSDSIFDNNVVAKFIRSSITDENNFIEIEGSDTISFISKSKLSKLFLKQTKNPIFHYYLESCDPQFWNTHRSVMKIGRYIKNLIENNKEGWKYILRYYGTINVNIDKEVETFVNIYKAAIKKTTDKDLYKKISIVSGEEIRKWYLENNYSYTHGTLGNSCMRYSSCQAYLDIYVESDNCQLIIFRDNEYNKLDMRALLWKLEDGTFYMDRIYAVNASDALILMNYAEQNGWRYHDETMVNDDYHESLKIKTHKIFDKYPYMDTFKYLELDSKTYYTFNPRNTDSDVYSLQNERGNMNIAY